MVILCTIDLETREVSLPAGQVIASYDHNVDVIRFQAETIPGFSLNTSSIRIAAQGPNKARHDYAVDPSTVAIEEETGYITFDWPIPAGVTEMPIGTFKYGDKGQLIFAVCAEIISGSTVSKAWHSDDGIITVVAHLEPESGGGEDPSETATNAQKIAQLQTDVAVINTQVGALGNGSPAPVATVAEMTDESAVYLYTGSETGYTAGNWYYYDGTAWTSGGTYGGAVTDTTLSISGAAADAKAVGQALADKADADDVNELNERLDEIVIDKCDTVFSNANLSKVYFETAGTDIYIKIDGTWHLRGGVHFSVSYADILTDHKATSPLGVTDCILIPTNYGIAFNVDTSEYEYVYNRTPSTNKLIIFLNGGGMVVGGLGVPLYAEYLSAKNKSAIDSIASDRAIYEVPSYFESQLTTKLAKIQTDINGGKEDGATQDTEAFIFITDVHWANNKKHSPALIKRILDNTSISTVICGGDLIYSHNATKAGAVSEIKGFIDPVKACAKEYFGVFGNHDDNSNSGAEVAIKFGKEEQYNLLYPQSNMGNVHWAFEESTDLVRPYRNDYYVDHPHTKTRFLCLDWNYGDLTARKAWVTSVLSKNDGYRVVVIYHGFYSNNEESLAEEHTTFLPTFEPHKDKVVGMFTGHVHFDDVVNYFDNNKAPIIITSCDTFRTAIGMTADTVTEQCFDVVVINYTTSKIHMTRIGFGQDRTVDFSLEM